MEIPGLRGRLIEKFDVCVGMESFEAEIDTASFGASAMRSARRDSTSFSRIKANCVSVS